MAIDNKVKIETNTKPKDSGKDYNVGFSEKILKDFDSGGPIVYNTGNVIEEVNYGIVSASSKKFKDTDKIFPNKIQKDISANGLNLPTDTLDFYIELSRKTESGDDVSFKEDESVKRKYYFITTYLDYLQERIENIQDINADDYVTRNTSLVFDYSNETITDGKVRFDNTISAIIISTKTKDGAKIDKILKSITQGFIVLRTTSNKTDFKILVAEINSNKDIVIDDNYIKFYINNIDETLNKLGFVDGSEVFIELIATNDLANYATKIDLSELDVKISKQISNINTILTNKAHIHHKHTIDDFPHNHDGEYYKKAEVYNKTEIDNKFNDFTLDVEDIPTHNHNDLYYTQDEINNLIATLKVDSTELTSLVFNATTNYLTLNYKQNDEDKSIGVTIPLNKSTTLVVEYFDELPEDVDEGQLAYVENETIDGDNTKGSYIYNGTEWIKTDMNDTNYYVDDATFNIDGGDLILSRYGLDEDVTVNLDGRYSLTDHTHILDDITDLHSDWDNVLNIAKPDWVTSNENHYVIGATFDDGVLSLDLEGLDEDVTVNLDGRYCLNEHEHTLENITDLDVSWDSILNTTKPDWVTSNENHYVTAMNLTNGELTLNRNETTDLTVNLTTNNITVVDPSLESYVGDAANQYEINVQANTQIGLNATAIANLTAELGDYVPYTGATKNVDLGDYGLSATEVYTHRLLNSYNLYNYATGYSDNNLNGYSKFATITIDKIYATCNPKFTFLSSQYRHEYCELSVKANTVTSITSREISLVQTSSIGFSHSAHTAEEAFFAIDVSTETEAKWDLYIRVEERYFRYYFKTEYKNANLDFLTIVTGNYSKTAPVGERILSKFNLGRFNGLDLTGDINLNNNDINNVDIINANQFINPNYTVNDFLMADGSVLNNNFINNGSFDSTDYTLTLNNRNGIDDIVIDLEHNHDDIYYTESEIDTKLSDINTNVSGNYVPYTGATDHVNLGDKNLTANIVKYNTLMYSGLTRLSYSDTIGQAKYSKIATIILTKQYTWGDFILDIKGSGNDGGSSPRYCKALVRFKQNGLMTDSYIHKSFTMLDNCDISDNLFAIIDENSSTKKQVTIWMLNDQWCAYNYQISIANDLFLNKLTTYGANEHDEPTGTKIYFNKDIDVGQVFTTGINSSGDIDLNGYVINDVDIINANQFVNPNYTINDFLMADGSVLNNNFIYNGSFDSTDYTLTLNNRNGIDDIVIDLDHTHTLEDVTDLNDLEITESQITDLKLYYEHIVDDSFRHHILFEAPRPEATTAIVRDGITYSFYASDSIGTSYPKGILRASKYIASNDADAGGWFLKADGSFDKTKYYDGDYVNGNFVQYINVHENGSPTLTPGDVWLDYNAAFAYTYNTVTPDNPFPGYMYTLSLHCGDGGDILHRLGGQIAFNATGFYFRDCATTSEGYAGWHELMTVEDNEYYLNTNKFVRYDEDDKHLIYGNYGSFVYDLTLTHLTSGINANYLDLMYNDVYTDILDIFVKKSGDTMTGPLTITMSDVSTTIQGNSVQSPNGIFDYVQVKNDLMFLVADNDARSIKWYLDDGAGIERDGNGNILNDVLCGIGKGINGNFDLEVFGSDDNPQNIGLRALHGIIDIETKGGVSINDSISLGYLEDDVFKANIKAAAFETDGGTSSQFVKGDGTLDNNTYLTSYTNNYVTGASFSTSNGVLSLTLKGLTNKVNVDLDGRYLTEHQSLDGYVPYTGATKNVDLGDYNLTANIMKYKKHMYSGLTRNYSGTIGEIKYTKIVTITLPEQYAWGDFMVDVVGSGNGGNGSHQYCKALVRFKQQNVMSSTNITQKYTMLNDVGVGNNLFAIIDENSTTKKQVTIWLCNPSWDNYNYNITVPNDYVLRYITTYGQNEHDDPTGTKIYFNKDINVGKVTATGLDISGDADFNGNDITDVENINLDNINFNNGYNAANINATSEFIEYNSSTYHRWGSTISNQNKPMVFNARTGLLNVPGVEIKNIQHALKFSSTTNDYQGIAWYNNSTEIAFVGKDKDGKSLHLQSQLGNVNISAEEGYHINANKDLDMNDNDILNAGNLNVSSITFKDSNSDRASIYSANNSETLDFLSSTDFVFSGALGAPETDYNKPITLNARQGTINANGYYAKNKDNTYMLLGGGGTKLLSDFANATHNHDTTYLKLSGGTLSGNLTVGSTTKGSNSVIKVLSDEDHISGFEAHGTGQGTGYLYVGQDAYHGGGIYYNGNGTPAFASGETSDTIGFYRRSEGTNIEVFYYAFNSNDVCFNGNLYSGGNKIATESYVTSKGYLTEHQSLADLGIKTRSFKVNGTDYNVYSQYDTTVNLDATYAPLSHTHSIANVTGLQTALDSKANTTHGHNYLPLSGGNMTGNIGFSYGVDFRGDTAGIRWTAGGDGASMYYHVPDGDDAGKSILKIILNDDLDESVDIGFRFWSTGATTVAHKFGRYSYTTSTINCSNIRDTHGHNMLTSSNDDGWLRLNDGDGFSNGIYCDHSVLRTDGSIQVGPNGEIFNVSSSAFTYKGTAISLSGHTHSYLPLSGGTLTGDINLNGNDINGVDTINATTVNATNLTEYSPRKDIVDFNTIFDDYGAILTTVVGPNSPDPNTNTRWYNLLSVKHDSSYGGQLAWGMTDGDINFYFRRKCSGSWRDWVRTLNVNDLTTINAAINGKANTTHDHVSGTKIGRTRFVDSSYANEQLIYNGNSSKYLRLGVTDLKWGEVDVALITDIPTKTSDLTNDSGFITSSSLPNMTNVAYKNVNNVFTTTQTIKGTNTSSLTMNSIGLLFDDTTGQQVKFVLSSRNSYRSPAGIKMLGNQGSEWFEAPRFIKTGANDGDFLMGDGSVRDFGTGYENVARGNHGHSQYLTSIPAADEAACGGIKIGYDENGKNYPVKLSGDKAYVTVPWTDNNTNYYVDGASFSTSNGYLTLSRSGLSDINVDLDGRYSLSHSHNYLPNTAVTISDAKGSTDINFWESGALSNKPDTNDWWVGLTMAHTSSYWVRLASSFRSGGHLYHCRKNNDTVSAWDLILDSSNYTSYAVPYTGATKDINVNTKSIVFGSYYICGDSNKLYIRKLGTGVTVAEFST